MPILKSHKTSLYFKLRTINLKVQNATKLTCLATDMMSQAQKFTPSDQSVIYSSLQATALGVYET